MKLVIKKLKMPLEGVPDSLSYAVETIEREIVAAGRDHRWKGWYAVEMWGPKKGLSRTCFYETDDGDFVLDGEKLKSVLTVEVLP